MATISGLLPGDSVVQSPLEAECKTLCVTITSSYSTASDFLASSLALVSRLLPFLLQCTGTATISSSTPIKNASSPFASNTIQEQAQQPSYILDALGRILLSSSGGIVSTSTSSAPPPTTSTSSSSSSSSLRSSQSRNTSDIMEACAYTPLMTKDKDYSVAAGVAGASGSNIASSPRSVINANPDRLLQEQTIKAIMLLSYNLENRVRLIRRGIYPLLLNSECSIGVTLMKDIQLLLQQLQLQKQQQKQQQQQQLLHSHEVNPADTDLTQQSHMAQADELIVQLLLSIQTLTHICEACAVLNGSAEANRAMRGNTFQVEKEKQQEDEEGDKEQQQQQPSVSPKSPSTSSPPATNSAYTSHAAHAAAAILSIFQHIPQFCETAYSLAYDVLVTLLSSGNGHTFFLPIPQQKELQEAAVLLACWSMSAFSWSSTTLQVVKTDTETENENDFGPQKSRVGTSSSSPSTSSHSDVKFHLPLSVLRSSLEAVDPIALRDWQGAQRRQGFFIPSLSNSTSSNPASSSSQLLSADMTSAFSPSTAPSPASAAAEKTLASIEHVLREAWKQSIARHAVRLIGYGDRHHIIFDAIISSLKEPKEESTNRNDLSTLTLALRATSEFIAAPVRVRAMLSAIGQEVSSAVTSLSSSSLTSCSAASSMIMRRFQYPLMQVLVHHLCSISSSSSAAAAAFEDDVREGIVKEANDVNSFLCRLLSLVPISITAVVLQNDPQVTTTVSKSTQSLLSMKSNSGTVVSSFFSTSTQVATKSSAVASSAESSILEELLTICAAMTCSRNSSFGSTCHHLLLMRILDALYASVNMDILCSRNCMFTTREIRSKVSTALIEETSTSEVKGMFSYTPKNGWAIIEAFVKSIVTHPASSPILLDEVIHRLMHFAAIKDTTFNTSITVTAAAAAAATTSTAIHWLSLLLNILPHIRVASSSSFSSSSHHYHHHPHQVARLLENSLCAELLLHDSASRRMHVLSMLCGIIPDLGARLLRSCIRLAAIEDNTTTSSLSSCPSCSPSFDDQAKRDDNTKNENSEVLCTSTLYPPLVKLFALLSPFIFSPTEAYTLSTILTTTSSTSTSSKVKLVVWQLLSALGQVAYQQDSTSIPTSLDIASLLRSRHIVNGTADNGVRTIDGPGDGDDDDETGSIENNNETEGGLGRRDGDNERENEAANLMTKIHPPQPSHIQQYTGRCPESSWYFTHNLDTSASNSSGALVLTKLNSRSSSEITSKRRKKQSVQFVEGLASWPGVNIVTTSDTNSSTSASVSSPSTSANANILVAGCSKGFSIALWVLLLPSKSSSSSSLPSSHTLFCVTDGGRSLVLSAESDPTPLSSSPSSNAFNSNVNEVGEEGHVSRLHKLKVQYSYQKHPPQTLCGNVKLAEGVWYHITFTHACPLLNNNPVVKSMWKGLSYLGIVSPESDGGSSPCSLLVNGRVDAMEQLRYPNFRKNMNVVASGGSSSSGSSTKSDMFGSSSRWSSSSNLSGTNAVNAGNNNNNSTNTYVQIYLGALSTISSSVAAAASASASASKPVSLKTDLPLHGCVSSFQLFELALLPTHANGLFHLGPSYRGALEPTYVTRHYVNAVLLQTAQRHKHSSAQRQEAKQDIETVLEGKLCSHLLLCAYPSSSTSTSTEMVSSSLQQSRASSLYFPSLALPSALRNLLGDHASSSSNDNNSNVIVGVVSGIGVGTSNSVFVLGEVSVADVMQQCIPAEILLHSSSQSGMLSSLSASIVAQLLSRNLISFHYFSDTTLVTGGGRRGKGGEERKLFPSAYPTNASMTIPSSMYAAGLLDHYVNFLCVPSTAIGNNSTTTSVVAANGRQNNGSVPLSILSWALGFPFLDTEISFPPCSFPTYLSSYRNQEQKAATFNIIASTSSTTPLSRWFDQALATVRLRQIQASFATNGNGLKAHPTQRSSTVSMTSTGKWQQLKLRMQKQRTLLQAHSLPVTVSVVRYTLLDPFVWLREEGDGKYQQQSGKKMPPSTSDDGHVNALTIHSFSSALLLYAASSSIARQQLRDDASGGGLDILLHILLTAIDVVAMDDDDHEEEEEAKETTPSNQEEHSAKKWKSRLSTTELLLEYTVQALEATIRFVISGDADFALLPGTSTSDDCALSKREVWALFRALSIALDKCFGTSSSSSTSTSAEAATRASSSLRNKFAVTSIVRLLLQFAQYSTLASCAIVHSMLPDSYGVHVLRHCMSIPTLTSASTVMSDDISRNMEYTNDDALYSSWSTLEGDGMITPRTRISNNIKTNGNTSSNSMVQGRKEEAEAEATRAEQEYAQQPKQVHEDRNSGTPSSHLLPLYGGADLLALVEQSEAGKDVEKARVADDKDTPPPPPVSSLKSLVSSLLDKLEIAADAENVSLYASSLASEATTLLSASSSSSSSMIVVHPPRTNPSSMLKRRVFLKKYASRQAYEYKEENILQPLREQRTARQQMWWNAFHAMEQEHAYTCNNNITVTRSAETHDSSSSSSSSSSSLVASSQQLKQRKMRSFQYLPFMDAQGFSSDLRVVSNSSTIPIKTLPFAAAQAWREYRSRLVADRWQLRSNIPEDPPRHWLPSMWMSQGTAGGRKALVAPPPLPLDLPHQKQQVLLLENQVGTLTPLKGVALLPDSSSAAPSTSAPNLDQFGGVILTTPNVKRTFSMTSAISSEHAADGLDTSENASFADDGNFTLVAGTSFSSTAPTVSSKSIFSPQEIQVLRNASTHGTEGVVADSSNLLKTITNGDGDNNHAGDSSTATTKNNTATTTFRRSSEVEDSLLPLPTSLDNTSSSTVEIDSLMVLAGVDLTAAETETEDEDEANKKSRTKSETRPTRPVGAASILLLDQTKESILHTQNSSILETSTMIPLPSSSSSTSSSSSFSSSAPLSIRAPIDSSSSRRSSSGGPSSSSSAVHNGRNAETVIMQTTAKFSDETQQQKQMKSKAAVAASSASIKKRATASVSSSSSSSSSAPTLLKFPCRAVAPFQTCDGTLKISRHGITFEPLVDAEVNTDDVVQSSSTKATTSAAVAASRNVLTSPRTRAQDTARQDYLKTLLPPLLGWTVRFEALAAMEARRFQLQPTGIEFFAAVGGCTESISQRIFVRESTNDDDDDTNNNKVSDDNTVSPSSAHDLSRTLLDAMGQPILPISNNFLSSSVFPGGIGFGSTYAHFITFETKQERDACVRFIERLRPPFLAPVIRKPRQVARELAARWRARKMSNLEYLLALNRLAGRTYNDAAQYPILPWVLCDYTSTTLDLDDPQVYRDLAFPVAAQSQERRRALRSKYAFLREQYDESQQEQQQSGSGNNTNNNNNDDRRRRNTNNNEMTPNGSVQLQHTSTSASSSSSSSSSTTTVVTDQSIFFGPPFHFGSCFMKGATVAWYLARVEPFTSHHVLCGDGRFDKSDRLFHSIAEAWKSASGSDADIKELVPQFFLDGSFLQNAGQYVLGWKQDGTMVGDVQLPPWAKTADDFIRIHRAALESSHVSSRLHLWVDLVFGHKQRPIDLTGGSPAAALACNTFHSLMYGGLLDFEKVKRVDEGLYRRVCFFMDEFGVLPPVLFPYPGDWRAPLAKNANMNGHGEVSNTTMSLIESSNNSAASSSSSSSSSSTSRRRLESNGGNGGGGNGSGGRSRTRSARSSSTIGAVSIATTNSNTTTTSSSTAGIDEFDPADDVNPHNRPRLSVLELLEIATNSNSSINTPTSGVSSSSMLTVSSPLFSRCACGCAICSQIQGIGRSNRSFISNPNIIKSNRNRDFSIANIDDVEDDHDDDDGDDETTRGHGEYDDDGGEVRGNNRRSENNGENGYSPHAPSGLVAWPQAPSTGPMTSTTFSSAPANVQTTNTLSLSPAAPDEIAKNSKSLGFAPSAFVPISLHSSAIVHISPIYGTDVIFTQDTERETGFHTWQQVTNSAANLLSLSLSSSSSSLSSTPSSSSSVSFPSPLNAGSQRWRLEIDSRLAAGEATLKALSDAASGKSTSVVQTALKRNDANYASDDDDDDIDGANENELIFPPSYYRKLPISSGGAAVRSSIRASSGNYPNLSAIMKALENGQNDIDKTLIDLLAYEIENDETSPQKTLPRLCRALPVSYWCSPILPPTVWAHSLISTSKLAALLVSIGYADMTLRVSVHGPLTISNNSNTNTGIGTSSSSSSISNTQTSPSSLSSSYSPSTSSIPTYPPANARRLQLAQVLGFTNAIHNMPSCVAIVDRLHPALLASSSSLYSTMDSHTILSSSSSSSGNNNNSSSSSSLSPSDPIQMILMNDEPSTLSSGIGSNIGGSGGSNSSNTVNGASAYSGTPLGSGVSGSGGMLTAGGVVNAVIAASSTAAATAASLGCSSAVIPRTDFSIALPPCIIIGTVEGSLRFYDVERRYNVSKKNNSTAKGDDSTSTAASTTATICETPWRFIPAGMAHKAPVTCIHALAPFDACVSASIDGSLCVWSLSTGTLRFRVVVVADDDADDDDEVEPVGWVNITTSRIILAHLPRSNEVIAFSLLTGDILGRRSVSATTQEPIQGRRGRECKRQDVRGSRSRSPCFIPRCFTVSEDGNTLVMGGGNTSDECSSNYAFALSLPSLNLIACIGMNGSRFNATGNHEEGEEGEEEREEMEDERGRGNYNKKKMKKMKMRPQPQPFPSPVTSLCLTPHENSLWIGLSNGDVRIFVGGF